jgi:hypothetical protein
MSIKKAIQNAMQIVPQFILQFIGFSLSTERFDLLVGAGFVYGLEHWGIPNVLYPPSD